MDSPSRPLLGDDSGANAPFVLDPDFVATYATIPPPFGFAGLSEFVYQRTYSRQREDGTKEQWFQTVERVVNGTYRMQQRFIKEATLGWDPDKAQQSAQEMYDRIWSLKFTPPGRGLFAMGSPITEERQMYAALQNCGFVSTADVATAGARPFAKIMDASMLGVGMGSDYRGQNTLTIRGPDTSHPDGPEVFVVPDSREGWVQSVERLLNSFFFHERELTFDYSLVRPAGARLHTFGGVSSGPGPLKTLHKELTERLTARIGLLLDMRTIVDIINLIGVCAISGNIRRTAEILFGYADDEDFAALKDYAVNPDRSAFGWASNNSVLCEVGVNFGQYLDRIMSNGEPGFAFIDNMRNYSRMNGMPDYKDIHVAGGNPCLEQSLEADELCCLVETFPARATDKEDYLRTLKFAYLYAKTVTLGKTHWPLTNRVMVRNRRIGCSMTGIAQFIAKYSLKELKTWCNEGYETIQRYDEVYSKWFGIAKSIKTTSIKPSGTVSLLAGATPGLHYPISRFYLRAVRVSNHEPQLQRLIELGFRTEPQIIDAEKNTTSDTTTVVFFPIDAGEGVRAQKEVSHWEQLHIAAFLQREWADNQVSATVTIQKGTSPEDVKCALEYSQFLLKGVSLLPEVDFGVKDPTDDEDDVDNSRITQTASKYKQLPYTPITELQYLREITRIKRGQLSQSVGEVDAVAERFCDGDSCTVLDYSSTTA